MNTKDTESSIPDFNRTQLHVMQLLWESEEPLKPSELESQFEWPIENATLRSVLGVMLERGDIDREKRGKAFFYFSKKPKSTAANEFLGGLARVFSKGSRVGLIAQLFEEEALTESEIEELRNLANSTNQKRS